MKLMHGDCLELMKDIPDSGVDMVLCDLPYGTTKNKWDCIIPLEPLWVQYRRVISDRGTIVLFAQTPFDKVLGASNLAMLKYEFIWNKRRPTGFMNANFAPMKLHENILVFSKASGCFVKDASKAMVYHPVGLLPSTHRVTRTHSGNYDTKHYDLESTQKFTNYPTSILEFAPETGLHPTQKPVPLLEYLIKTYTNEGETVLDNCAGSGSTGVACVNTNREFIGIELDDKYFEIASNRIREARRGV